jgi:hypothetical protein
MMRHHSATAERIQTMDFNELVADFAKRHAVEGLAAQDGTAALDIDGITVTLVETGDCLVARAEIGEPPSEGRADFAEILLEANLESADCFAKTRETSKYVLMRHAPLASLSPEGFDAALESLVNTAETWRRLLADFRPAAALAAAENAEAPSFGEGGFLQV